MKIKNDKKITLLKQFIIIESILLILMISIVSIIDIYFSINAVILELLQTISSTIFLILLFTILYLLQVRKTPSTERVSEVDSKSDKIKKFIINIMVGGGFLLIIVINYTDIFSSNNKFLRDFTKYGGIIGFVIFISGCILALILFGKTSKETKEVLKKSNEIKNEL